MNKQTVKPADLRVGDRVPRIQDDYSVLDVPVASIEKIRPHRATVYAVTLEGEEKPTYFHPNAQIEVTR